jgi:TatD DNase family protein
MTGAGMLIDSHCHLDFPDFAAELDAVMARAASAGVGAMLTISTHMRRFERLRTLTERYENVCCSIGTHPHYASAERDVRLKEILDIASLPKVVAIGEAGLDYHYDTSHIDDQEAGLRLHIAAARETGLPLVIHSREADEHMASLLEEEMAKGAFKAVLHCFTGGADLARRGLALGLYISFSGVLTFKNSDALRAIAAETPMDRLLVETDAPYLAPVPMRGKRNEPAHVRHTAKVLAEVKGVSEAEIADITTANFFRLFAKAQGQLPARIEPAA